ncbi:MAG TPA: hypothetical protein VFE05_16770 [Longimicrobiaceae bacterium]|nr:hypothetical protein [Longimicrobiaceae bacterium]
MSRGARTGSARHLQLRLGLFFAAGAVLMAAMALDRRELALVAAAIGIAAMVLRFIPDKNMPEDARPRERPDELEDAHEAEDEHGGAA